MAQLNAENQCEEDFLVTLDSYDLESTFRDMVTILEKNLQYSGHLYLGKINSCLCDLHTISIASHTIPLF